MHCLKCSDDGYNLAYDNFGQQKQKNRKTIELVRISNRSNHWTDTEHFVLLKLYPSCICK